MAKGGASASGSSSRTEPMWTRSDVRIGRAIPNVPCPVLASEVRSDLRRPQCPSNGEADVSRTDPWHEIQRASGQICDLQDFRFVRHSGPLQNPFEGSAISRQTEETSGQN